MKIFFVCVSIYNKNKRIFTFCDDDINTTFYYFHFFDKKKIIYLNICTLKKKECLISLKMNPNRDHVHEPHHWLNMDKLPDEKKNILNSQNFLMCWTCVDLEI